MKTSNKNLEIERKFLIKIPAESKISSMPEYKNSEIEQIYLTAREAETRRVRKIKSDGKITYTKTEKRFVTYMTAEEYEREISEKEYQEALKEKDSTLNTVKKNRRSFFYEGHTLEIDTYPFWNSVAVMEVELENEAEKILFPDFIEIIREVTGEKEFKNRMIAEKIPELNI